MPDQSRLQVRKNDTENTWADVGNKPGNESLPVVIGNTTPISVSSQSADFKTNDIDKTTTTDVIYIGAEKSDGEWVLKKYNKTTGNMSYASINNNPTLTTYTLAWAARLTATYGDYSEAF